MELSSKGAFSFLHPLVSSMMMSQGLTLFRSIMDYILRTNEKQNDAL